jgi:D-3-phosphoglycerate dehydrogenase
VENTPNAHVDGVAELAISGILTSLRGIAFSDRKIRQGEWSKPMGALLRGKTVGLIGMGKIAKRLVQLLQPFECKILAFDPFFDEQFALDYNIIKASLDEIYELSNIISLHLPFSNESKNIINHTAFEKMKKDVLIVNTSRGGLINESELFQFLTENKNAKAYLDTFETEPYNGELISLDNILMTGHIGTYAKEVRKIMELEAAQKLINYFQQHGK